MSLFFVVRIKGESVGVFYRLSFYFGVLRGDFVVFNSVRFFILVFFLRTFYCFLCFFLIKFKYVSFRVL